MKTKGSATLLTLMVVAIVLTIAISFNWYVKEYLKNVNTLKSKAEAMIKVNSTFDILKYLLLIGSVSHNQINLQKMDNFPLLITKIPLNGDPFNLFYDDITIKVQDTNGLISLKEINEFAFRNMLSLYGINKPEILLETYYDWIDTDSFKRVHGAESEDYKKKGYPYLPRNYELQYKREILLIKEFNEKIYNEISPFITFMPSSGFNPNTAPMEVLISTLKIDRQTAQKIKDYIKNIKPISSENELYLLLGRENIPYGFEFDFMPSGYFEIIIQAHKNAKIVYEIGAGFGKNPSIFSPYTIVHWSEN